MHVFIYTTPIVIVCTTLNIYMMHDIIHGKLSLIMSRTESCWYPALQYTYPDSKVQGVIMGPIWGPQDQGEPHVGPMNFAIWVWETRATNVINRERVRLQDVQFSCAINQPLLTHHWRVHRRLLTSRFIAPSISWGVSTPGGKMRKQLLKDHDFLNNSPIFIIESSTFNIFAFQKALHTIYFNLKKCFGFGERYLIP